MPSRPPSSFPNRSPQMIVPSRAWRLPLVKTPQREDDKQRGDHRNHGEGNQLSLPFVEQAPPGMAVRHRTPAADLFSPVAMSHLILTAGFQHMPKPT
jgi:hypothetical protein